MGFSEQLKKARLNKGLTQQEIANLMGITKSTYCGYETNKRHPDVAKIKQLANILDVSCDVLLETGPYECLMNETIQTSRPDTETRLLENFRCLSAENQTTLLRLAAKFAAIDKALNAWLNANEPC